MEILQILIVIGVIVFAIVKQIAATGDESKKQKPQQAAPPKSRPFLSYDNHDALDHYEPDHYKPEKPSPNKQVKNTKPAPPSIPILEEQEDDQEFNIHSPEEVRRGIIWSEILHRKY